MKAIRVTIAVAAVLSLVTLSVPAGLFNVTLKVSRYATNQAGDGLDIDKVGNADFISDCTTSSTAKLVAQVDDISSNVSAIVTVDECGNVICTNVIVTLGCSQVAVSSSGKSSVAAGLSFITPDSSVSGQGFLSLTGTVNPTNTTDITNLKGKGSVSLCDTNGEVLTGTISVSSPFKPGKDCLQ